MKAIPLALMLLLAISCGDDDAAAEDAGPRGEPCPAQGHTDTGCTCEEPGSVGLRSCGPDLVWTPCSCPPVRDNTSCAPGEPIVCAPCPGEEEPRRGVCRENGTPQCTQCDDAEADAGAMGR